MATRTLLDDVEQAFEAEHEPAVLRRARELFAEVTARSFDLRLRGGGTFVAHDVRQDAVRALSELSSGTRMQLLLALRMAWMETLEPGGETLPLFLDKALTTSDEARFAVMAQSLERLAGEEAGGAGRTGDRPGNWRGEGTGDRAAAVSSGDRGSFGGGSSCGAMAGAGPSTGGHWNNAGQSRLHSSIGSPRSPQTRRGTAKHSFRRCARERWTASALTRSTSSSSGWPRRAASMIKSG